MSLVQNMVEQKEMYEQPLQHQQPLLLVAHKKEFQLQLDQQQRHLQSAMTCKLDQ